ncbi:MAG: hypothetical protein AAF360_00230 [Pseudomonadota bacterium]
MSETLTVLGDTVRTSWRRLLIWGLLFVVLSQVAMMFALIIRFQATPNYVTFYDWPGNVWWIIKSTPSWADIWPIIAEEWLIEIGQMNYEYGTGISVWSLNVVPSRLVVMFILGATIGLSAILLRRETCSPNASRGLTAATGVGAVLVAMTNATMSWVVCCATPSWVVGLAMLGLGVSTSLALETMGPTLMFAGFSLLCAQIFFLAWRKSRRELPQMRDSYA